MAFPAHYLLAFGGHLGTSAANVEEGWTCTLRFTKGTSEADLLGIDVEGQALADVAGDVRAWWADANMLFSDSAWLSFVKFNHIDPNGRYSRPTTNETHFDPIPGTRSSAYMPWQSTIVATFDTGLRRGRAHAGRMYLPPQGIQITRDGTIGTATAGQLAASMATFLRALNNWPGIDLLANNYSAAICSKVDGSHHAITSVRVGQVVDTHRSRRRSLPEAYQTVTL